MNYPKLLHRIDHRLCMIEIELWLITLQQLRLKQRLTEIILG